MRVSLFHRGLGEKVILFVSRIISQAPCRPMSSSLTLAVLVCEVSGTIGCVHVHITSAAGRLCRSPPLPSLRLPIISRSVAHKESYLMTTMIAPSAVSLEPGYWDFQHRPSAMRSFVSSYLLLLPVTSC